MRIKPRTEIVSFKTTRDEKQQLQTLAALREVTASELIREAVNNHLNQHQ